MALHDLTKSSNYLDKVGWRESVYQKASVDQQGEAIPWITYPALAFIEPRLHTEMAIFEYGSGNSTIWWAKHVAQVVSCEHDAIWHRKMVPLLPENVQYIYAELNDGYPEVILQYQREFDIVVIDGRKRVQCVRNAMGAMKPDGVIIWDNTNRDRYQPGIEYLHANGFRQVDFWGMVAIVNELSCTSVFYRPDNRLGI